MDAPADRADSRAPLLQEAHPPNLLPDAMPRPYQPSLLRLLHGAVGVLSLSAWISGLVLFLRFDHRWGAPAIPFSTEWIEIHGTIGVVLFALAPLFGLYAVTAGRARLQQPTNLLPLLALALAIGSGTLMDEDWLVDRQLNQLTYNVHLLAWVLVGSSVLLHLASVLKRGGWPLARSMASLRLRANDLPGQWPGQLLRGLRSGQR
ncbi:MAG: cytochrome b/b6 domain-containing protein [Cyanobacteriota bacterium]